MSDEAQGNGATKIQLEEIELESPTRRKVLGWLVGAINAGVGVALAAPTLGFIASPLRQKQDKGEWVAVASDGEIEDGQTRIVAWQMEIEDGYTRTKRNYSAFVRRSGDAYTAFDPSCPHLGCHVEYKEKKKRYVCPCHGGVFDDSGNVISGPPPHGLAKIDVKVEGGHIWLYKV